jgi:NADH-quinone oxidoreductase subunit N
MLWQEIVQGLPELILILAALFSVVWGAFREEKSMPFLNIFAASAFLLAFLLTFFVGWHDQTGFFGLLVFNAFTQFIKQVILLAAAAVILMNCRQLGRDGLDRFEFPILILFATAGMMMMVSAHDLIAFFMALELQSLSLYILVAFQRDQLFSTEAALKYFILGALSTIFILYGSSFLYAYAGGTQFSTITALLKTQGFNALSLKVSILLVLIGVSFKIAVVPFHMWAPDVYQGSPTAVTAFLSSAPKAAGVAIFIRFILEIFHPLFADVNPFLIVLSVLSMLLGAFAALFQKNIKRLLAYGAMSHMGYALLGLVGGHFDGVRSVLIYIGLYVIMSVTAFACLLALRRHGKLVEDIDELSGLSADRPLIAGVFTITLFSFAGIPPLAGFFAKFSVFSAAIQRELYGLALIGVLTSVVSAAYYLKIIKVIYFDKPLATDPVLKFDRVIPRETVLVMVIGLILTVGYIFESGWLNESAYKATKALYYRL